MRLVRVFRFDPYNQTDHEWFIELPGVPRVGDFVSVHNGPQGQVVTVSWVAGRDYASVEVR